MREVVQKDSALLKWVSELLGLRLVRPTQIASGVFATGMVFLWGSVCGILFCLRGRRVCASLLFAQICHLSP